MPTIAEAVGIKIPEQCNGLSFLPVLFGEEANKHQYLNWEFHKVGNQESDFRQAVRIGNFKAVRYGVHVPIKLFDLSKDIAEKNDIADQHPELLERVKGIFKNDRTQNSAFPYRK